MKNQEAFVYCWTDHRDNKFYVGYHKGSQDDGYVCSQEELKDSTKIPMMVEYRKRPQDFTRMILAEGTAEDCRALEETILVAVDAARSDRFYNQHNGGKNFVCEGHLHTKEWFEKYSGEGAYWYGKKLNAETCQKISKSQKGKKIPQELKDHWSEIRRGENNPFYGKKHKPSSIKMMSEKHKGHRDSAESRKRKSDSNPKKGKHWFKLIVKCPHCGKIGDSSNMHRWHFDKCKKRVSI